MFVCAAATQAQSAPLLESMPNPPATERLPEIQTPTLIIAGHRDVSDIHEICGLLYARIPGQGNGHSRLGSNR
jgi:pimeloyl-ACP methyl ester carboxylesterase